MAEILQENQNKTFLFLLSNVHGQGMYLLYYFSLFLANSVPKKSIK